MTNYKGTRAERYRSRLRSEGRRGALLAAKRVGEMLDTYVLARHGEVRTQSQILWGRIILSVVALLVLVGLILHFV